MAQIGTLWRGFVPHSLATYRAVPRPPTLHLPTGNRLYLLSVLFPHPGERDNRNKRYRRTHDHGLAGTTTSRIGRVEDPLKPFGEYLW